MQSIFFGASAPIDDCAVAEAVTIVHEVARGWPIGVPPELRRPILGDAAMVDAIRAVAAGDAA